MCIETVRLCQSLERMDGDDGDSAVCGNDAGILMSVDSFTYYVKSRGLGHGP